MNTRTCILLFLFACMVNQSYAQADYDSLKQKVLRMDLAVNNIHYNMKKHHDQFRSGATITAGGTALALVGIILIADRKEGCKYHRADTINSRRYWIDTRQYHYGRLSQVDRSGSFEVQESIRMKLRQQQNQVPHGKLMRKGYPTSSPKPSNKSLTFQSLTSNSSSRRLKQPFDVLTMSSKVHSSENHSFLGVVMKTSRRWRDTARRLYPSTKLSISSRF